ncbi:hypothetical protein ANCCAN_21656 [Ancylostoma caninum]|uniref:Peptidase S1 domain-containing protein n=1 Tax=Ancylostoma caninum TaxID=29170 RepID=A0A368FK22_ANCCA|nr:hypothetical protein ANCCAN_21656 [Ancylostoma caninum]
MCMENKILPGKTRKGRDWRNPALQVVELPLYSVMNGWITTKTTDNPRTSACPGDSGGPLVQHGRKAVLLGIYSAGYNCTHPARGSVFFNHH